MKDLIYKDKFISITRKKDGFYIESFMPGMPPEKFNDIINTIPMIKISSFMAVKSILSRAPHPAVFFGEEKDRIVIEVSNDQLKAYLTLNIPEKDLKLENRKALVEEILSALAENEVVYGINTEVLRGDLHAFKKILIAEGFPAVNGNDAEIRQYEIKGPKPQIIDNNKVNHYELNLINHVTAGDWLGERKDPTRGLPGKAVTGKQINPIHGKMLPLLYDRSSVREEYIDGLTTLYAKKSGAVCYKGDSISVYDYLEIKGNVDFKTGNVDFDGYLTVKGTVEDNFTISANRDIEIMGEYGVGAAHEIDSRDGNIYIKGGIAGQNKALIRCSKNLYVKYLKDVEVECAGTVYVGFYTMNAIIRARQVIIESTRGKIIGGKVVANIRVESPEIGNKAETRTIIQVTGFDRGKMKARLDGITDELEDAKKQMTKIKQVIQIFSNAQSLTKEQKITHNKVLDNYAANKDKIRDLEMERRNYTEYLRTPGEGAVIIKSRVYPKVRIEIKNSLEEINEEAMGTTYYYHNDDMHTMK